jgi:HPt (histidine-containing phosphotransfer) domain-containing protein
LSQSGDTSTSQMSSHALALRFLTRTQAEVAQMTACLPEGPIPIEAAAIAHIQRMAHRISSGAEAFGFPEIDTIAAGIELMTQDGVVRGVRQRIELVALLTEKIATLSVYVEYELAEKEAKRVPDELPMSAHLPGFGTRRK